MKYGKKLPKSIRKYIRKEKARIRREVLDTGEQKGLIDELYKQFIKEESPKEPVVPLQKATKEEKPSKISKKT